MRVVLSELLGRRKRDVQAGRPCAVPPGAHNKMYKSVYIITF